MEIANRMQDEVIRIMNVEDPDREEAEEDATAKYDHTMVGVFYHAWLKRAGGDMAAAILLSKACPMRW